MERKFLGLVAVVTGLVIVIAFTWRIFAEDLMRYAFVPDHGFAQSEQDAAPDYTQLSSWQAHPDLADHPALFTPEGYAVAPKPAASVFFVTPTAWTSKASWNAPLADAMTEEVLKRYVKNQASVFNGVADVWIPRYRQAALGAFLQPGADADQALALAYGDVERAFDQFLQHMPADRPIILAGHSQGARHLLHLLKTRREALGSRLVAVYAPGWPIALPQDLETLALPACTRIAQSGCVLSWQSYAADAEMEDALEAMAAVPDLSGQLLATRATLCTNPLLGANGAAGADRNTGLLDDKDELQGHMLGARCDSRGLLRLEPGPDPKYISRYVMPGGNYHVYDYALFWANLRADVEARLSAHAGKTFTNTSGTTLQPEPAA